MRAIAVFKPDHVRYEGVRPLNIYLLRFIFLLIFAFVGSDAWAYILGHQGPWDPVKAVAWCMFASYSLLSLIGVFRPLKMLPVMLFIVIYKSVWLLVVAYPLWRANQLAGSAAEGMTKVFLWVPIAMVATPWRYVLDTYILRRPLGERQRRATPVG